MILFISKYFVTPQSCEWICLSWQNVRIPAFDLKPPFHVSALERQIYFKAPALISGAETCQGGLPRSPPLTLAFMPYPVRVHGAARETAGGQPLPLWWMGWQWGKRGWGQMHTRANRPTFSHRRAGVCRAEDKNAARLSPAEFFLCNEDNADSRVWAPSPL